MYIQNPHRLWSQHTQYVRNATSRTAYSTKFSDGFIVLCCCCALGIFYWQSGYRKLVSASKADLQNRKIESAIGPYFTTQFTYCKLQTPEYFSTIARMSANTQCNGKRNCFKTNRMFIMGCLNMGLLKVIRTGHEWLHPRIIVNLFDHICLKFS